MLPPRVVTGVFYLAGWILLAAVGGWPLTLAIALLACIALVELRGVVGRRRVRLAVEIGYPICVGFVWAAQAFANDLDNYALALIGLIVFALLADFSKHLSSDLRSPTPAVSITLLGCVYCGLCPSMIVAVRGLDPDLTARVLGWDLPAGERLLFFLLAVTMLSDVGGFVFGRLFGRHKFSGTVSPKKSVEGLLGAVGGAVLAALAAGSLLHIGPPLAAGVDPGATAVMHRVTLGVVLGLTGQLGDFGASIFKREAEVKDYGWLFPGHGGVLDRLDALIINAPVLFLYAKCAL
jgi:phosphatidate cytidylyltransferase